MGKSLLSVLTVLYVSMGFDKCLEGRPTASPLSGGIYRLAPPPTPTAPPWAGFIALMNQSLGADGAGFLSLEIYSDASAQNTFENITSGSSGAFSAKTGFDQVTGWGSPNGTELLSAFMTLAFAQMQMQLL